MCYTVLCNSYKKTKLQKLCNTDENGQPNNTCLETVGCVYNRYRLAHRWVPEMVLNVQSDSLIANLFLGPCVIISLWLQGTVIIREVRNLRSGLVASWPRGLVASPLWLKEKPNKK